MARFYNQATLVYNGNTTTSNITTGEIIRALSATKTASIDTYGADDTIFYVISIVNSTSTAFTDLTLIDNLGAYSFNGDTLIPLDYVEGSILYYINGELQADPVAVVDNDLIITGITVPANGSTIIAYAVTTNQYAPLESGSTITNEVEISGCGLSNPLIIEETITAEDTATLSITKALSPTRVAENGEITYTFVIENTGNEAITVEDSVVITDLFDPVLNNISVTFNGVAWSEPTNYTYNEATGLFTTEDNQITVPAATFTQNPTTGEWTITPGRSTLVVRGTI